MVSSNRDSPRAESIPEKHQGGRSQPPGARQQRPRHCMGGREHGESVSLENGESKDTCVLKNGGAGQGESSETC